MFNEGGENIAMTQSLLEIRELRTYFYSDQTVVLAVDGVDMCIHKGEIVGVVGESGCGKSALSHSIMRLIPSPPGKIVSGAMMFTGENLVVASEKRMQAIRGNRISMIFQEPMTSLNPVYTIGEQIGEMVRLHRKVSKQDARLHAIDMLKKVGISRPEAIVKEYPHQLSGGMRQRVMIAMAMSCEPQLLIADEPTTALDVTIQAQILELMKKLNNETGTAIMLITHDLGVVAEICDRVAVMYSGKVVEEGDVRMILKNPQHPYTKGLIESIPRMDEVRERLFSITGNVPNPSSLPKGCRFAPRCEYAMDKCHQTMPELVERENGHKCRCWLQ
ncbi:UNVERIFIED_CONTAM: peptide/nickel transport system ATP-binding protein [Brevibacillus sp. OAP136]